MANAAPHLDFFRRAWQGVQGATLADPAVPAPWRPEDQQQLLVWAKEQKAAGTAPLNLLAYLRAQPAYQAGTLTEAYIKQAFDAAGLPYTPPDQVPPPAPGQPPAPPAPDPYGFVQRAEDRAKAAAPTTGFQWTKPRIALAVAGGIFLFALTWFAVARVRGRPVSGTDDDELDNYEES